MGQQGAEQPKATENPPKESSTKKDLDELHKQVTMKEEKDPMPPWDGIEEKIKALVGPQIKELQDKIPKNSFRMNLLSF